MRVLTKAYLSRSRLLLWAKYSASSVIATVVSQVAFALCYWFGTAAIVASLVAWLSGAIPNYVLNRRWTWGRSGQKLPYTIIVVGSAVMAAVVTSVTDHLVQPIESHAWQTLLVTGSYLATYAVLFIVKFVLFDRLVFAKTVSDPAEVRTPVAT
ncbi:GtrA-like protein [Kribbella sp. VKM Ac-2569]|uniref:GtrA family protein n=1 Tax=Kribbella sp. VKM Ac-2569 TaxID=2512220 RepID=UPI00102C6BF5|nr:GtrA family protein [Kribbella sp. VKM Ac-2569]RZT14670.1 GtrA-like protein [Kribbella sp. VKM Ac-2569]